MMILGLGESSEGKRWQEDNCFAPKNIHNISVNFKTYYNVFTVYG